MKRKTCLLVSLLIGVSGTVAIAGITGTAHDFTSVGWNSSGELCLPCHVPHNSLTDGGASLILWNHEMAATDVYTMYSPFATDRTRDPKSPFLGGPSKLCLSCHDGTIALDSFGGATGSTSITGVFNLGTDLRDDHPIGIEYPNDGTEYHTDPSNVKLVTIDSVDRVECVSCHDPHSDANDSFLRVDNSGSALCLTCHNK